MARRFLSGSNRALVFLRRLSHSLSSQRAAAAGDYWSEFLRQEVEDLPPSKRVSAPTPGSSEKQDEQQEKVKSVEISHPWPEWVELMERLLKRGYMDRGTFQPSASTCSSSNDVNQIRTACLNFARERSEIIRYLSRKDIGVIVGSGCPSLDRKVVNSAKRLRAFVGANEGEVCSSCKLRGNCERAYVKAHEEERGRTLDVMRVVLIYGFDAVNASVEGKPWPDKAIKESLRKLLNDILELSINEDGSSSLEKERTLINIPMKKGDWVCPKFLNFAKNVKCLRCDGGFQERLAKLREDREHLPLKKGDWICEKCNFLNFAKNAKCLQCNEKPTNRLINPGEWECASCNYINFRKNYFCLKCGWKRPKATYTGDEAEESHRKNKGQQNKPSDVAFPSFIQQNSFLKREGSDNMTSHKYRFCKSDGMDARVISEFNDFPILGGKSAISRDSLARKRWKEEMWCRKTGMGSEGSPVENGNQAAVPCGLNRMVSDESCNDEDDIAGWFKM